MRYRFRLFAIIAIATLSLSVSACADLREIQESLGGIPVALQEQFNLAANIHHSGNTLTISVVNPTPQHQRLLLDRERAKGVARVAAGAYRGKTPIETVVIQITRHKKYGPVNSTSSEAQHVFSSSELRDVAVDSADVPEIRIEGMLDSARASS